MNVAYAKRRKPKKEKFMAATKKLPGWAWVLILIVGIPLGFIILFVLTAIIVAIAGIASGTSAKTPPPSTSVSQLAPASSAAPSQPAASKPVPTATQSTPSAQKDYVRYKLLDISDLRVQRFLADFRDQFPKLVGSEADKYLMQNGTKICQEFSYRERSGQPKMTKVEIERFISLRSTFTQQPNQATSAESWKIAKLATKNICPEFKNSTSGAR